MSELTKSEKKVLEILLRMAKQIINNVDNDIVVNGEVIDLYAIYAIAEKLGINVFDVW